MTAKGTAGTKSVRSIPTKAVLVYLLARMGRPKKATKNGGTNNRESSNLSVKTTHFLLPPLPIPLRAGRLQQKGGAVSPHMVVIASQKDTDKSSKSNNLRQCQCTTQPIRRRSLGLQPKRRHKVPGFLRQRIRNMLHIQRGNARYSL